MVFGHILGLSLTTGDHGCLSAKILSLQHSTFQRFWENIKTENYMFLISLSGLRSTFLFNCFVCVLGFENTKNRIYCKYLIIRQKYLFVCLWSMDKRKLCNLANMRVSKQVIIFILWSNFVTPSSCPCNFFLTIIYGSLCLLYDISCCL